MKSARLYGKEIIQVVDLPIPDIGDHELLVKVKAASICGTDVRMVRNGYKNVDVQNPLTLGHEFAGIIEKRGKYVSDKYKIGTPVAVAPNMGCGSCEMCISGNTHLCPDYQALGINLDGAFSEYIRIPEKAVTQGNVMIINDHHHHIPFEQISLIEPLSCVYNGQEPLRIGPGDNVLIVGGGPIGILHALLAKARGASNVFLNDRHDDRLSAAKEIEPSIRTISMNDDMKKTVFELTNGRGMDVVIVASPAHTVQSEALEWMNMNGRISYFGGLPAGKEMVPINTNLIHYKQLLITGSTRASLLHFHKSLEMVVNRIFTLDKLITQRYNINEIEFAITQAKISKGFKNVIIFDE